MHAEGVQNLRTNKGMAYILSTYTASLRTDEEPAEAIHEVFAENGLGHMVKSSVHPQTLRAYVKEQLEAENDIPEEVLRRLDINVIHHLRVHR